MLISNGFMGENRVMEEVFKVKTQDGATIHISCFSRGEGESVLVLPGFFRSRLSPMIRLLSERLSQKFGTYAVDFRGHGTSGGLYTFGRDELKEITTTLSVGGALFLYLLP